jgi:hypothetical protein
MQAENSQPVGSLSQRAYLIAESLRGGTRELLYLLFGMIGYTLIGTAYVFLVPEDTVFPRYWLSVTAIIFSVYAARQYINARTTYRKVDEWEEDYLEQAYILVFDTTIPKGNSSAEKILTLAREIFPELRSDYIPSYLGIYDRIKLLFKRKFRKSEHAIMLKSTNYKVSSEYSVDLALETPVGYFIVKDFKDEVVTTEELKHLINSLNRKFRVISAIPPRVDMFRVVCVAKNYDESFLNRESLEKQMTQVLKPNIKLDLILEEKVGYSVLWVS